MLEFGGDAKEGATLYNTDSKFLPETPVGPLHFATSETMAKLLLDNGVDVDDSPGQWGTPLHAAAERGDIAVAKFLLKNGADVDFPNGHAAVPLHIAADQGHLDMATLLLDHGADVNFRETADEWDGNYYGTPLHLALLNNGDTGFPVAKLLLERGADPERTDNASATPLHIAAAKCSRSTTKLLLDHGAPVDVWAICGRNPLFGAVDQPDPDVTKLLLDHGALVNIPDKFGITPLFMAVEHADSDIAKLLLEHGARVSAEHGQKDFESPLHQAVVLGVVATMELFISHGAQVNEQNRSGMTCLRLVRNHPDPAMTKLLLDHGALVDMQDNSGSTALHDVVRKGYLATADLLLLSQGVLIKAEDDSGQTSYQLDWRREDLVRAKLLIDHGASLNILDTEGKSALDYAADNEERFVPSLFVGQDSGCGDQPK